MSTEKKITEEELKGLQELIQATNEAHSEIGRLEFAKSNVLKYLDGVMTKRTELTKGLEETYGEVSINITTGEITEVEKEEEAVEA